MEQFISGMICMAYLGSGLFFLRFWTKTGDRLFLLFSAAFWIMTGERFILGTMQSMNELKPFVYLLRLVSFGLILYAVIDKNKSER